MTKKKKKKERLKHGNTWPPLSKQNDKNFKCSITIAGATMMELKVAQLINRDFFFFFFKHKDPSESRGKTMIRNRHNRILRSCPNQENETYEPCHGKTCFCYMRTSKAPISLRSRSASLLFVS